jgi:hypothetical protein
MYSVIAMAPGGDRHRHGSIAVHGSTPSGGEIGETGG